MSNLLLRIKVKGLPSDMFEFEFSEFKLDFLKNIGESWIYSLYEKPVDKFIPYLEKLSNHLNNLTKREIGLITADELEELRNIIDNMAYFSKSLINSGRTNLIWTD